MATKKVNIDIVAKDKSANALKTVRGSLDRLKSSVFNVRNALAGLGAGLVIRNLVNTGKELENLETRFKFLLKNADEGAKAFDNMSKFASKVPFSLEEIQSGSGILATVTDNAEDLQNMLEITGNVAAVTGLDFRTAAEQIQRSFSAGIGAADLFREKGVRNMLGFQAGATVSIEETVEAFQKVFGKDGEFGQATDELAQTFEGTLSMIGDKFFNFKRTILEAGFFPELKRQFGDLNQFLEDNTESIDAFAEKIGKGLAIAVSTIADGFRILKDNIDLVVAGFSSIIAFKIASTFTGIGLALASLTTGMRTFNAVVRANIIFGSIAIFTGSLSLLIEKFREFKGDLARPQEPTTVKELEEIVAMHQATIDAFDQYKKAEEEKSGQSKKLNKQEVEEYRNATNEIIRLTEIKGTLLLKENSKAYAEMKDSVKAATDEMAKIEIENQTKKDLEIAKILKRNKIESIKLFYELMEEETLAKEITQQNVKKIQDEMLAETQSYYDKFTEAMSKRYRMEKQLIRENKEEQDAQLQKYTEAMLKRGRINDEAMSKDKTLFTSFKSGFKEAMDSGADAMTKMKEVGRKTFDELSKTLTDFVMTGKLNFQSLAKTIIRMLLEALIGSAIKSAIAKSESMLLMSSIRNAMRSVYEGALRTFASIPFPLNIAATGLAIKFGMGLVSKLRGFERGGIARANQPAIVGERGPELIMPRKDMQVTPNNKLGTMGGSVNVNFTINAVDTRGFRSLLTNERGTIVNIINQAVTDKGRPVLV